MTTSLTLRSDQERFEAVRCCETDGVADQPKERDSGGDLCLEHGDDHRRSNHEYDTERDVRQRHRGFAWAFAVAALERRLVFVESGEPAQEPCSKPEIDEGGEREAESEESGEQPQSDGPRPLARMIASAMVTSTTTACEASRQARISEPVPDRFRHQPSETRCEVIEDREPSFACDAVAHEGGRRSRNRRAQTIVPSRPR